MKVRGPHDMQHGDTEGRTRPLAEQTGRYPHGYGHAPDDFTESLAESTLQEDRIPEGLGRELRRRMDEEERAYEAEVKVLMARQRRLSLLAAGLLFGTVGGFTLATFLAQDFMSTPVWHGFSPALLFAAVLVYPLTWLIALLYTIRANHLDEVE